MEHPIQVHTAGSGDMSLVQENCQQSFLIVSALTGTAIRDIGLRVVDVESGVCVQDVRVVHGCVHASDGRKSLRLHMTSFKTQRLNAGSVSIPDGMSHARKIYECATTGRGVRKRKKCADPESVLFTHPSVTERLPSLVADPSFFYKK